MRDVQRARMIPTPKAPTTVGILSHGWRPRPSVRMPMPIARHQADLVDRGVHQRAGGRAHVAGDRVVDMRGLPAAVAHQEDAVVQAVGVRVGA